MSIINEHELKECQKYIKMALNDLENNEIENAKAALEVALLSSTEIEDYDSGDCDCCC